MSTHYRKMVKNTIASYVRIGCNAVLTVLATRFALEALGASDFGLYNLIAGVVAMLSFINGALIISSQRYYSIAIGRKCVEDLRRYFYSSLVVHLILGGVIGILMFAVEPLLFKHIFNIDASVVDIGKIIYRITVVASMITVMTIPYSALINAKEDMVAMSIFDIISIFIKFLAAFILLYCTNHLLIIYTTICFCAVIIKWICEFLWCHKRYNTIFKTYRNNISKEIAKEMTSFVGWNTIGSFSVLVRNQGVAMVLNVFFGTIINAAYGIANQVNGLVLSFATTLTTVFTPSIIAAKGAGDDKRMITLARMSSKLSFMLSAIMALPVLIFLNSILSLWLTTIPKDTTIFCEYIVFCFLVQQLYPGLNRALYADGRIKWYQITTSILLVTTLPVGYYLFSEGFPAQSIMIVLLIAQILVLFSTIYFSKKHLNVSVKAVIIEGVILPCILFLMIYFLGEFCIKDQQYGIISILFFGSIIDLTFLALYYLIVFSKSERALIKSKIFKRNAQGINC